MPKRYKIIVQDHNSLHDKEYQSLNISLLQDIIRYGDDGLKVESVEEIKEPVAGETKDNVDSCLVCGKEIPPGPDCCSPECDKKYAESLAPATTKLTLGEILNDPRHREESTKIAQEVADAARAEIAKSAPAVAAPAQYCDCCGYVLTPEQEKDIYIPRKKG